MTRRTTVIGFGTGLVLVGLALVVNFGLSSLLFSRLFGDYSLFDPLTIDVESRAIVTDDVELLRVNNMPEYVSPDEVRVEAAPTGSAALFMGIAPAEAVAGYLDGVAHDEIAEWESGQDDITDVVYTTNEGTSDPASPGTEDFWATSASGSNELALDWTVESGEWALVIMNADGSPGVAADVRFGVANPSVLLPVGSASLVLGLMALIGGGRLVSSVPARPDKTSRWTLRGRPVLPTTAEGGVALLCTLFVFIPFTTGTVLGAPIFLFLGVRKGDRGLSLVLPLIASILVIAGIAFVVIYNALLD